MRIDVSKVLMEQKMDRSLVISLTADQKMYVDAMARVRNVAVSAFVRGILDQIIEMYGEAALEELEQIGPRKVYERPKRKRGRPRLPRYGDPRPPEKQVDGE